MPRSIVVRSRRRAAVRLAWVLPSCAVAFAPSSGCSGELAEPHGAAVQAVGAQSISFQDGVAPSATYAGTRDTHLWQANPSSNYGTLTANRVDGDDPAGSTNDVTAVTQWDVSAIPPGSTVQSATITLNVTNITGGTYQIYEMLRPWVETQATWSVYATGSAWQTAGASGTSDRGTTALGTVGSSALGSYTLALNAAGVALVQRWVNDPSTNHGIAIANSSTTDGMDWSSREATTASQRPALTVTYDPPAMDAGTTDSGTTDSGTTDSGTTDSGTGGTAPSNTALPTISGTTTVGSTLTATTGSWSGTTPITYGYQWLRCDTAGASCANVTGATASTYVQTGNDPLHTLRVRVTATNGAGSSAVNSAQVGPTTFPSGTVCNASGAAYTRPARLNHVIVILMENKNYSSVMGNSNAPYINSIRTQCGYSTNFVDNVFSSDLVSLPHYMALTSGSNCNTGVGNTTQTAGATGCITDDSGPSSHRLSTQSIFNQVASWRAYQESMPSACATSTSLPYAVKHNPPPYYTAITTCPTYDVPIAGVTCPTTLNTVCSAPSNTLTQDLANDTLPAFSFVTPDQNNDMHDGTVGQGDNWLHTYLPRILQSRAYLRGDTAVYVLWDEQGSFSSGPTPNLFISPYVQPTASATTMNLFAALRSIENQLGIGTHLGCAGGTPPGGIGTCAAGWNADLRSVFNF